VKTSLRHPSCFQKKKREKKKNEFPIVFQVCRRTIGSTIRCQGRPKTNTSTYPTFPHLSPLFLAFFPPHCAYFSKTVFSIGGSVFSTRGSCRNYREPEMDIKGSLRDMEASLKIYKSSCSIQTPLPSCPSLHHTPSIILLHVQEKHKKTVIQVKKKNKKIRKGTAPSTSPEAHLLPLHLYLHLWHHPHISKHRKKLNFQREKQLQELL